MKSLNPKLARMRIPLLFVLTLTLGPRAIADPNLAFDAFQALQGAWSIRDKTKTLPIEMTYQAGSHDTIVTEQFGKELSVFYLDKGELWMTHYCNRGNQPRLKLASPPSARQFEFKMAEISNLTSPADPHVQRIIYKMGDPTHFELELIWKIGGETKSEKYSLTKK